MGFKANARKRRDAASAAAGPQEKEAEEYVGEIKCDVAGCDNWSDKKIGGRKLAFDRAVDVWGESGLTKIRSVSQYASHATGLGRRPRRTSQPSGHS